MFTLIKNVFYNLYVCTLFVNVKNKIKDLCFFYAFFFSLSFEYEKLYYSLYKQNILPVGYTCVFDCFVCLMFFNNLCSITYTIKCFTYLLNNTYRVCPWYPWKGLWKGVSEETLLLIIVWYMQFEKKKTSNVLLFANYIYMYLMFFSSKPSKPQTDKFYSVHTRWKVNILLVNSSWSPRVKCVVVCIMKCKIIYFRNTIAVYFMDYSNINSIPYRVFLFHSINNW